MEINELINLAKDCGFTEAAEMDAKKLKFMPEVRDMCRADKCNSFNKSWSCPPACGTLEEITERSKGYSRGLLVQTVGRQEDEYDFAFYEEAAARHSESFTKLTEKLLDAGLDLLPMGMGACTLCERCTYPDAPCRFPERLFPSMEAYGLLVTQVCIDNDVSYYYGPGTIAYVSCYLFN